jgi:hypothetical protein
VSDHLENGSASDAETRQSGADATTPPEPRHDERDLKGGVREAISKAVGIAIEAGSMLAGNSGELVSAEGRIAEADTERLIDRIDGEE